MSESQLQNLRFAIRKKKARIEEINLICSQHPRPGVTSGSRRRLIEKRLHLEQAVEELDREVKRLEFDQADRNFRWEDINQQLLSAKTNEIAEEMSKRISEGRRRIEFECAQLGNSAAFPLHWCDFMEQIAEERARRIYEAHREAWTQQNRVITPTFIRAIRDRVLGQVFAATKSSVASNMGMRARRISEPLNPSLLVSWSMRMDRLATRWNRKLEADAIATGYTAWGPKQPSGSASENSEFEDSEFEEREQLEAIATQDAVLEIGDSAKAADKPAQTDEGEGGPGASNLGNTSRPIAYQSPIKRAILMQFLSNPAASTIDICRGLDATGDVEVPEEWKTHSSDRLFAAAYRNRIIRPKIEVTISKVRADLRKRGIIPPR